MIIILINEREIFGVQQLSCLISYGINKALDIYAYKFCTLCFSFLLFTLSIQLCSYTHISNCRSISTLDPIDNNYAISSYNFENPINQAEDEGEEDCDVTGELARLLQKEERAIQPHEEPFESVNLGT